MEVSIITVINEYPSPMVPSSASSPQLESTSSAASSVHSMALPPDTFPSMVKASISGIPVTTSDATSTSISRVSTSGTDVSAVLSSSKTNMISLTPLPHRMPSQQASSLPGASRSIPAEVGLRGGFEADIQRV